MKKDQKLNDANVQNNKQIDDESVIAFKSQFDGNLIESRLFFFYFQ